MNGMIYMTRLTRIGLAVLLLFLGVTVKACPWCATNAVMKPTVLPEHGDPGGKFFGKVPPPELTRRYFIAAEPDIWNFIPLGEDPVKKALIPPHITNTPTASKLRYVQYTDETFTTSMFHP